jgi:hypothetical protein
MLNQTLSDSSHYGAEAHIGVFSLDTDKLNDSIKIKPTPANAKRIINAAAELNELELQ